jgi:hypothetical protein
MNEIVYTRYFLIERKGITAIYRMEEPPGQTTDFIKKKKKEDART